MLIEPEIQIPLPPRLHSIAVLAEHLAVVGDRTTALVPRGDMVGLHLLDREVFATVRTDPLLSLVRLALLSVGKGADI